VANKKLPHGYPVLTIKRGQELYTTLEALLRDLITLRDLIYDAVNHNADNTVLPSYTVATLPSAVNNARRLVYVSDEAGGPVPAFSDGTNWRRVTDRAIVS